MTDRSRSASLRTVLERSADGARLRRRIGALGGCGVLLGAMLAATGLGALVAVAAILVVAVAAAAATAVVAWRARGGLPRLHRPALRSPRLPTRRELDALRRVAAAPAWALRRGARRLAGELLWAGASVASTTAAVRAHTQAAGATGAPGADPLREALRLNAQGVELRRGGEPERAAACHREALAQLEELGDRRAAALTRNNIALALERAGLEEEAVAQFEEAIWTLRGLDDPEREGQVMANLGAAHLRRGRTDAAGELFVEALERLGPHSEVRETVERQLARVR